MIYKHPTNDYREKIYGKWSWLWVFLFGPAYWAIKGVWTHCVAHFLLSIATFGVAHFIYPFFTYAILENHYEKNGWIRVD